MDRDEKLMLLSLLIKYIKENKYINWEEVKKDKISVDLIIEQ